jgi:UDPglucose 6-dehydrogenase
MRVCVYGLYHLGSVTVACLAAAAVETIGLDDAGVALDGLKEGRAPLFEPGLDELLAQGIKQRQLTFTDNREVAVSDADIVWVTFDTPVDEEDRADTAYVMSRVESLFPFLRDGAVVLVSSQMPVGSIAALERAFAAVAGGRKVHFACSPENLRLGAGIKVFTDPGRIIIGTRGSVARSVLEPLLARFCDRLIWISVESAEMTKHAINAYLATCVTFINEIATVCETVGADASQVEIALRSEPRIGEKAYIRPGSAFAGGTLARDVVFLGSLGEREKLKLPLLKGIIPSNRQHGLWPLRQVQNRLASLAGRTIAVLGLSYKPGTSSIRRSGAIELVRGLLADGAIVRAYDPEVKSLPPEFSAVILCNSALEAANGASCLVVSTEWPSFRDVPAAEIAKRLSHPLVIDMNRYLSASIGREPAIEYVTFGRIS